VGASAKTTLNQEDLPCPPIMLISSLLAKTPPGCKRNAFGPPSSLHRFLDTDFALIVLPIRGVQMSTAPMPCPCYSHRPAAYSSFHCNSVLMVPFSCIYCTARDFNSAVSPQRDNEVLLFATECRLPSFV
jgi:hypothetical protein